MCGRAGAGARRGPVSVEMRLARAREHARFAFWPRDASPKAVALLLPSSDGGLGPGVARYPQALEKCHTQRGRGALFLRLAHELATGRCHTWSYEDTGSQLKWQTNHHGKFVEEFVKVTFLHSYWTGRPCGRKDEVGKAR